MNDKTRAEFRDDKLAAKIIERDGALWMELTDRVTERTWPASPLLRLEIHDKRLRREERVEKYKVEAIEVNVNGAHITVTDVNYAIAVGIWFEIIGGELSVRFSTSEAYENEPVLFRLFAVDVLPSLMKVSGADSRLLMPVNGATLCRPVNKPPLINTKAIGIVPANGKTLAVKDLEQGAPKTGFNWPGDVGMSFHNDGEFTNVTLDILPHDFRLLRIE